MQNTTKQQQLEARGFIVGNASDFLGLSPVEEALVETSHILSNLVRETREAHGLTQGQLAKRLGTSQPNIGRLESGISTTFDKQFAALYEMGLEPREIADAIASVEQSLERVRSIASASHDSTPHAEDDATGQNVERDNRVLETA